MKEIERLVVRFAGANPSWGYRRIESALANPGHHVARTTIAKLSRKNGIEPAFERGSRILRRTFLGARWSTIAAIELRGPRVHFAGMTPGSDDAWIRQVGRNTGGPADGFLTNKQFCLMDRDAKLTTAFRTLLTGAGIAPVPCPSRIVGRGRCRERLGGMLRYCIETRRRNPAAGLGLVALRAWRGAVACDLPISVVWRTVERDARVTEPRHCCARRRLKHRLCSWTLREPEWILAKNRSSGTAPAQPTRRAVSRLRGERGNPRAGIRPAAK